MTTPTDSESQLIESGHDRHVRPTLTVSEAAELLGVSRWLIQQQVGRGALPAVRLGRRILIPRARLLAWLEGHP